MENKKVKRSKKPKDMKCDVCEVSNPGLPTCKEIERDKNSMKCRVEMGDNKGGWMDLPVLKTEHHNPITESELLKNIDSGEKLRGVQRLDVFEEIYPIQCKAIREDAIRLQKYAHCPKHGWNCDRCDTCVEDAQKKCEREFAGVLLRDVEWARKDERAKCESEFKKRLK